MIRFAFCAVLAMLLFCGCAGAVEMDEVLELQAGTLDLNRLQEAAQEYAPEMDWTKTPDLDDGLIDLFETGTNELKGIVKKAVRSGVLLITVVLLTGLTEGVSAAGINKTFSVSSLVAVLAITAIAVTDSNALIGFGSDVIEKMELFSKVLLPTMTATMAASGSPGRAAAHQVAVMLFSDVLISMINRLLLPLVYVYIAACAAFAAVGNEGLKRISSTLKWAITTALTTVLIVFVGYLSISGVIAGTTDAVALKATKFTVSNMVPVVGGILSDAAETVLAGAGLLKNTVGVFGLLVVFGMCIVPFLQLGVHYLVYKIAAVFSASVAASRVSGLIEGLGNAFGLVLGMTGASAVLLLLSIILSITMVST